MTLYFKGYNLVIKYGLPHKLELTGSTEADSYPFNNIIPAVYGLLPLEQYYPCRVWTLLQHHPQLVQTFTSLIILSLLCMDSSLLNNIICAKYGLLPLEQYYPCQARTLICFP